MLLQVDPRPGRARSARQVPSGASLEEHQDERGARVLLRAPDGVVLVEYRPETGAMRLHAAQLQLEAEGDLQLRAGGRVRVDANEAFEVCCGNAGQLRLTPQELALEAASVSTVAGRVEVEAKVLRRRVGELHTQARRIVERTVDSFRQVEQLAQTHAGRLRLVAQDSLWAMGRRAYVKAREELKLRGERIYLD